jgi:hypothetical protein
MTRGIEPILCGLVSGAAVCLGLLWTRARFVAGRQQGIVKVAYAMVTALAMFVPVNGVPLWNWVFSLCPNPSLPMVGLVGAALAQRLGGVRLLQPAEWRTVWIFGAVAGTVLYLHPLLPGSTDPYYWGWHHTVSVGAMAGLALVAFAGGNRAGFFPLAAMMAYELRALESPNGWDYLVDPFYWMLSLGFGAAHLARAVRVWWAQPRGSRPPFVAAVLGRVARE